MKALTKKLLAIALAAALFLSVIDGPAMLAQWWPNRIAEWSTTGLHFSVRDGGGGEASHLRFTIGSSAGAGGEYLPSQFVLDEQPELPLLNGWCIDESKETVYDDAGPAYRTNVVNITSDDVTTHDVSLHYELDGWDGLPSILNGYVFIKKYDEDFNLISSKGCWVSFWGNSSRGIWIGDINPDETVSVRACYWGDYASTQDSDLPEDQLNQPFGITTVVSAEPAGDVPMGSVPVNAGMPTITPPPPSATNAPEKAPEPEPKKISNPDYHPDNEVVEIPTTGGGN